MANSCVLLQSGEIDTLSPCTLRMEFLQSLCLAEKLKFLDCITHICAKIHRSQSSKSEGPPSSVGCKADSGASPECREGEGVTGGLTGLEEGMKSLNLQAGPSSVGSEEVREKPADAGRPSGSGSCDRRSVLQYGMGAGKVLY